MVVCIWFQRLQKCIGGTLLLPQLAACTLCSHQIPRGKDDSLGLIRSNACPPTTIHLAVRGLLLDVN
jgi:hypothetical protein